MILMGPFRLEMFFDSMILSFFHVKFEKERLQQCLLLNWFCVSFQQQTTPELKSEVQPREGSCTRPTQGTCQAHRHPTGTSTLHSVSSVKTSGSKTLSGLHYWRQRYRAKHISYQSCCPGQHHYYQPIMIFKRYFIEGWIEHLLIILTKQ